MKKNIEKNSTSFKRKKGGIYEKSWCLRLVTDNGRVEALNEISTLLFHHV